MARWRGHERRGGQAQTAHRPPDQPHHQEEKCYYVDKTEHIKQLAKGGGRCLLSRLRRFGKSLLLVTLKELFEGTEPLFRGLAIHAQWDWSVRHPVARLSFGGRFQEPGPAATGGKARWQRPRVAGRGEGLQPLRPRTTVRPPPSRRPLVRDSLPSTF